MPASADVLSLDKSRETDFDSVTEILRVTTTDLSSVVYLGLEEKKNKMKARVKNSKTDAVQQFTVTSRVTSSSHHPNNNSG